MLMLTTYLILLDVIGLDKCGILTSLQKKKHYNSLFFHYLQQLATKKHLVEIERTQTSYGKSQNVEQCEKEERGE